ncbi:MAG: DUF4143 domain-containing protein [Micrococcales bacterium]|nr:DUF4143 domain-containing protein [Micrococcales bacterium]
MRPSPSNPYRPRLIDAELAEHLQAFGGVLIEGAKWCGKTWTGRHHATSETLIDDPDVRTRANLTPKAVLAGSRPRLVDEWQEVPKLWDVARRLIDDAPTRGQFIFTGSATPPLDATSHSGTGRFARLRMRPMSLFESGHATGQVSLAHLLAGGRIDEPVSSELTYPEAIRLICRGGWPVSLNDPDALALRVPRQLVSAIAESDISRLDGVARDPLKVRSLLYSLARNTATLTSIPTIHDDIVGQVGPDENLSLSSVRNYLKALTRIFVVEDLPSWRYQIRAKSQMLASPKRHLVDPSLAVAALDVRPAALEKDPKTTGFLFESLCVRDLRIYAQANDGNVFHYHDNKGLEADAIVTAPDGTWGAIEVKLDWNRADEAARSLLRLKAKLADKIADPAFLMILTATGGVAHTRDDGVHHVQLDCLGP